MVPSVPFARPVTPVVRHPGEREKMLFRATQKVRDWLRAANTKPLLYDGTQANAVKEWYCNILILHRRKCLLFTHSATLFSFLIVGVRYTDARNFGGLFRSHAAEVLAGEGITPTQIVYLVDEGPDEFAKAENRSVLGSMNDLAKMCKFRADYITSLESLDVDELNREMNLAPMGYIGMENATRALKTRLNSSGVQ